MYTYTMMGVSHVGKTHAENEDCILKRVIEMKGPMGDIFLLGVADGIGSTPCGGSVARWIMEKQLAVIDNLFIPQKGSLAEQMQDAWAALAARYQEEFKGNEAMLQSGAAVSVAGVQGAYAECFWAGDVAVFINRAAEKYAGEQVSKPDHDPSRSLTRYFGNIPFDPHHRKVRIAEGDILTIASDGANIDEHVLQHFYGKQGCSLTTLKRMMNLALRSPRADDVSIVALMRR